MIDNFLFDFKHLIVEYNIKPTTEYDTAVSDKVKTFIVRNKVNIIFCLYITRAILTIILSVLITLILINILDSLGLIPKFVILHSDTGSFELIIKQ